MVISAKVTESTMTAKGMTSVSVSLETRRQLNQMRSMLEMGSIDILIVHLLKEQRLMRLKAETAVLRSRMEQLDGVDVDDLLAKLRASPI